MRTDSTVLERLAEYMMDNSGNLNSPNNIANVLDANRVPTNHVTVGRYISHLRDALVFHEAKRYDIKGKKRPSTRAKHYACDSGMRYAVLGTRDMDWGRMYENAAFLELAFLELMRRGRETYVGKLCQKGVGARLHPGERRHQLRIDAREGACAAPVRRGRVPEGPYRPHEAWALYPGGRARAGPREVAARRASCLH